MSPELKHSSYNRIAGVSFEIQIHEGVNTADQVDRRCFQTIILQVNPPQLGAPTDLFRKGEKTIFLHQELFQHRTFSQCVRKRCQFVMGGIENDQGSDIPYGGRKSCQTIIVEC